MSWWKELLGLQEQQSIQLPELSANEDELYRAAAKFVVSSGKCSLVALQHHLRIGYNRAATLIEALENDCVVSPLLSSGARRLLTDSERQQCRLRPSKAEILLQKKNEETALRLSYLLEKYNDEAVVINIMKCMIWESMTAAQLFDSLGEPEAIDQKYLKQISREVWKYNSQGSNRYRLRVTLENGAVVGWDKKS